MTATGVVNQGAAVVVARMMAVHRKALDEQGPRSHLGMSGRHQTTTHEDRH